MLHIETDGPADGAPILLIANTVLGWDEAVVGALAEAGHRVVRYDLRGVGQSDPCDPDYTLRDLVADSVFVLDTLRIEQAHVAGVGVGGFIAQLLALDQPGRVRSLTLLGTRPTAPGRADDDLPDHDAAVMAELFGAPGPDWGDRDQVVDYMARSARLLSGGGDHDDEAARDQAGRVFDRAAPASDSEQRANQMAAQFASIRSGKRWRERLGDIEAPTLVLHGELDPFFPLGNGEALAREIPGARLVVLPRTGAVLTPAAWERVAAELAAHVAG